MVNIKGLRFASSHRRGRSTRFIALRRPLAALVAPLVLLVVVVLAAPGLGTVGGDAGFEDNDGNLIKDATTTTPIDWNSFGPLTSSGATPDWTGTSPYRTASKTVSGWAFKGLEDAAVSSADSSFAGGVKQDDNCGTLKPSKAPNKDDLKRIYLASKVVNDEVYLMLGWVRIPQNSTTASAHIGFEFNQGTTKVNNTNNCPGTLPNGGHLKQRTGGDMLIVYDFEGGNNLKINLSRWLTTSWVADHTIDTGCQVGNSSIANGCWGDTKELTTTGFAEGAVWQGPGTTSDTLKPGGTDPGPVEFGEAGLDLTDAGVFSRGGSCETFGNEYAVSRSSGNSQQAAMEDIVGPGVFSVTNCGSLVVQKTDGTSRIPGAAFTVSPGQAGSTTPSPMTQVTDANGNAVTGLFCLDNLLLKNSSGGNITYTVHESTVPTGYQEAADQQISSSSMSVSTCASRGSGTATTPTPDLTFVNTLVKGSLLVNKVDDDNRLITGATFTWSDGSNSGSLTETSSGSGRYCADNLDPRVTYTVTETTTPPDHAGASPQSGLSPVPGVTCAQRVDNYSGGLAPTIYGGGADLNGDGVVNGDDDSNAFYGDASIIDGSLDCDGWASTNAGTAGDGSIDGNDDCTLLGYDGTGDGLTINVVNGAFATSDPDGAGGSPAVAISNGTALPTVFPQTGTPNDPDISNSKFAWSTIGGKVDSNGNESIDDKDCHFGVIGGANVLGADPGCGFAHTILAAKDGLVDLNADDAITPGGDSCYDGCFFGHDVVSGLVKAGRSNATFVNQQLHKVIVIVCHQADGKLAPSKVYEGSNVNPSFTSVGSGAIGTISESDLCGLTGISGKQHGNLSLTVTVGSDAHPQP